MMMSRRGILFIIYGALVFIVILLILMSVKQKCWSALRLSPTHSCVSAHTWTCLGGGQRSPGRLRYPPPADSDLETRTRQMLEHGTRVWAIRSGTGSAFSLQTAAVRAEENLRLSCAGMWARDGGGPGDRSALGGAAFNRPHTFVFGDSSSSKWLSPFKCWVTIRFDD